MFFTGRQFKCMWRISTPSGLSAFTVRLDSNVGWMSCDELCCAEPGTQGSSIGLLMFTCWSTIYIRMQPNILSCFRHVNVIQFHVWHPLSVGSHWDIYTVTKSLKTITICVTDDGTAFAIGELELSQFQHLCFLRWIAFWFPVPVLISLLWFNSASAVCADAAINLLPDMKHCKIWYSCKSSIRLSSSKSGSMSVFSVHLKMYSIFLNPVVTGPRTVPDQFALIASMWCFEHNMFQRALVDRDRESQTVLRFFCHFWVLSQIP